LLNFFSEFTLCWVTENDENNVGDGIYFLILKYDVFRI